MPSISHFIFICLMIKSGNVKLQYKKIPSSAKTLQFSKTNIKKEKNRFITDLYQKSKYQHASVMKRKSAKIQWSPGWSLISHIKKQKLSGMTIANIGYKSNNSINKKIANKTSLLVNGTEFSNRKQRKVQILTLEDPIFITIKTIEGFNGCFLSLILQFYLTKSLRSLLGLLGMI
ncbi:hypothetical protein BpHYR1_051401 [Brachionus plicatilis]|uniref:Uncharacterized protein n=1 Tax=Brachionus plicatilis TaxID=10195 RepID=A0A3M7S2E9_BRAPC|nr:hypothetical protein BpHYR1_051401 [Brachionus plicatilis]